MLDPIVTLEQAIEIHGRVLWLNYRENGAWVARQRAADCARANDLEGVAIWEMVEKVALRFQLENKKDGANIEPLTIKSSKKRIHRRKVK